MINHPLTILRRMPVFAKPGLILRKPPVQVGEGTCQVQRRQPVLIRYQIKEVSGSRRTGATLLFLADPKPQTPPAILFPPPNQPLHLSCHSLYNRRLCQLVPANQEAGVLWQLAVLLIVSQRRTLRIRSWASNFKKCPSTQPDSQVNPSQQPWTRNQHLNAC